MTISDVRTDDAPAAIGPYVQARRVAGEEVLLFLSGQLPIDPATGNIVGDSLEEQTERALANALSIVRAAGGEISGILKVTVYLTDLSRYSSFNEVYAQALADHRPARSVVQVSALPRGALVEIELIATCN